MDFKRSIAADAQFHIVGSHRVFYLVTYSCICHLPSTGIVGTEPLLTFGFPVMCMSLLSYNWPSTIVPCSEKMYS